MKKAKVLCGLVALAAVALVGCKGAPTAKLAIEKNSFLPGEGITVTYAALPEFDSSAWIGIIPSNIPHGSESENDQHDISYQYLKKSTSGQKTFTAPAQAGTYDFRMHDTDSGGKEVASVTFTVSGTAPTPAPTPEAGEAKASMTLPKTSFQPGESITVTYVAEPSFANNAWIGIIPSNIPHGNESQNDQHDISYQYLKKSTSGQKTFTAPSKPGTYDFRMHDTDSSGREVASVTFEVGASAKPEKAAPSKFGVGDPVLVEWKGSWWPAKVIATRAGSAPYKIHYDGYSNSWDEWIGNNRIKRK